MARYEVHCKRYNDPRAFTLSEHRSLNAACRSLASIIASRGKHHLRGLEYAAIWDSETNYTYPLNRAREIIKEQE